MKPQHAVRREAELPAGDLIRQVLTHEVMSSGKTEDLLGDGEAINMKRSYVFVSSILRHYDVFVKPLKRQ